MYKLTDIQKDILIIININRLCGRGTKANSVIMCTGANWKRDIVFLKDREYLKIEKLTKVSYEDGGIDLIILQKGIDYLDINR